MTNINIPNLGPAGSQGAQNNAPAPAPTPSPMKKMAEKAKSGGLYLAIAGALVSVAYLVAGWVMGNTELGWFWGPLVVFIIAILIIWAIDGATGSEKTPARTPVKAFLIIVMLSSMIKGCNEDKVLVEENDPAASEVITPAPNYSETLDLSVATFAATKKIFSPGDKPQILVEGNPVRLNQDILAPGEYFIPVTGSGPLVFDKLDGKPAIVYLY
jgi:hypothetical protein